MFDPTLPTLSVAWMTGANVPARVGTPERTPEEESVRPGGRPDRARNVYGPVPPVAVKVMGV